MSSFSNSALARIEALRPPPASEGIEPPEPERSPTPPSLPLSRSSEFSVLVAVESVGARGRIRLRDAVEHLGWSVGARVVLTAEGNCMVIRLAADHRQSAAVTITSDKRVPLKVATLFYLGVISAGEVVGDALGRRVLIETDMDGQVVRLKPLGATA